jgi:hypothetical protein
MRWLLAGLLACGAPNGVIPDASNVDVDATPGDAMSSCPRDQWCVEAAPVTGTLLHAVWAVTAGEVFAVGDGGTILRRRDGAWTVMESGTTANLRGVWAASATDAWAVGEAGTVLRYDGSGWSPLDGIELDLQVVWGASPTDVFLAGPGRVFHWDGSMFTSRAIAGEPLAIHGTGADDVWVTGESSRVNHYSGTWTTGIDPGAGSTYFAVLALAPDDVWVATFVPQKETWRFDGATWTPHAAAGTVFQGFYGIAPDDLWAAGGSKVGHWDGTRWDIESPGGAVAQYWGAHGAGSSVWIVGSESLILHRN